MKWVTYNDHTFYLVNADGKPYTSSDGLYFMLFRRSGEHQKHMGSGSGWNWEMISREEFLFHFDHPEETAMEWML